MIYFHQQIGCKDKKKISHIKLFPKIFAHIHRENTIVYLLSRQGALLHK